jgi:hypothetical protein
MPLAWVKQEGTWEMDGRCLGGRWEMCGRYSEKSVFKPFIFNCLPAGEFWAFF